MAWASGRLVLVCIVLGVMAVLMVGSASHESLTHDEVLHIPAGVSYLQYHDARLNVEHPPLLKMLAALPAFAAGVRLEGRADALYARSGVRCDSEISLAFFSGRSDIPHIAFLTRLPMIVLTLLMALGIYRMADALGGFWGAIISLVAFAASPLFLAHGALVTTDLGVTFFSLLAAWTLAALWCKPGILTAGCFSMALAGALLSKFSGLLLLPAVALFVLWMLLGRSFSKEKNDTDSTRSEELPAIPAPPETWALRGGRSLTYVFVSVAAAMILCYGFYWLVARYSSAGQIVSAERNYIEAIRIPERVLSFTSNVLRRHPRLEEPLMPFWVYASGIGFVNAELTRPAYLVGHRFSHGVWFYFPVLTLFKTPPGELGLFLLLGVSWIFGRKNTRATLNETKRVRLRALLSLLIVFLIACLRSRINIGLRHFMVPLAVLIVLTSLIPAMARGAWSGSALRTIYGAAILLSLCSLGSVLIAYPNYVSYYNFFRFRTPKQEVAVDSNLDWGQSLIRLNEYTSKHRIGKIYVDDRATLISPQTYVENAVPWQCDDPSPATPEWVAVSADFLVKSSPTCAGLLRYSHAEVAGNSIYVFHVTDNSYAREAQHYHAEHPDESVAPIVHFRKGSIADRQSAETSSMNPCSAS